MGTVYDNIVLATAIGKDHKYTRNVRQIMRSDASTATTSEVLYCLNPAYIT